MASPSPFVPDAAVELTGVTKSYRLYESAAERLKEALHPFRRAYHRDFHALSGVSLSVPRGETWGFIGLNGSGKSTLLKIVCGVTKPSAGEVVVRGRVAALLELGAGFNPEFTGRQNVYFTGALAGFDRRQMDERMDDILAFADIGTFVDQPVKSYSSGMMVRLAFAVASHVDPDILVVDEALAVGDLRFQHKCLTRIQSFKGKSTILLVTHDMGAVVAFCDRVAWLHEGRVRLVGSPAEVVKAYTEATYEGVKEEPEAVVTAATQAFGRGRAVIEDVRLAINGRPAAETVEAGDRVRLSLRLSAREDVTRPLVGFIIKNRVGIEVLVCNNQLADRPLAPLTAGQTRTVSFEFYWPKLRRGSYAVTVAVADGVLEAHTQEHWIHDAVVLECLEPEGFPGILGLEDVSVSEEK
jgi:ABC-type polysaccharide/polyol phosphate transport system ATPase subunit